MVELFDWIVQRVSYDAERDFYAKHFPSVAALHNRPHFRPMTRHDLNAIVAIEQQIYDFPWSKNTFWDCLKISSYSCWVYEQGEEVIAYGILSIAAGESHVMNVCVSPTVQRQGYGLKMMNRLIDVAGGHHVETMLLEVRPSNEPALNLYRNMGFNEIGTRKDYYPAKNGREDALILALDMFVPQHPQKEDEEQLGAD
jgi:[ribosomal protein S18]-alanine N-acetyltransferase